MMSTLHPLLTTGPFDALMNDLFTMGIGPVDKVVRTVCVYLGIALLLRVAGKRLMAQMNSLDLVVVLLLSNVVQNAIIGDDNSLSGGLLGAVVLVVVNAALDRLSHRSARVRWLLEGSPTVLVRDGNVDETALTRLGITTSELRQALRRQSADSAREVKIAQIDPGGAIVVDLLADEQSVSRAELRAAVAELSELIRERR